MGYCNGETKKLPTYIRAVANGDTGESCFYLVRYLVNGECIRRGIALNETAFWDISVDVYMQIKERLERYACDDSGQYTMERDIKNPVGYIYFATPKRFCALISKRVTEGEKEKQLIDLEKISNFISGDELEDIDDDMETIQKIVSEYLGEATTNRELKARKQKVRGAGYSVVEVEGGYEVRHLGLTISEIEKVRKAMENITASSPQKIQEHKKKMLERLEKEEQKCRKK